MEVIRYLDAGTHESISPGDTATAITAAIQEPTSGEFKGRLALAALITVEGNSIRICYDGTTPTNAAGTSADVGHKMDAGQNYLLEGARSVEQFKCIDAVSGSVAVVKVTPHFGR